MAVERKKKGADTRFTPEPVLVNQVDKGDDHFLEYILRILPVSTIIQNIPGKAFIMVTVQDPYHFIHPVPVTEPFDQLGVRDIFDHLHANSNFSQRAS